MIPGRRTCPSSTAGGTTPGTAGSEVQPWNISDPDAIRLHDTVQGLVQANMMHVTYDGRRLYMTKLTPPSAASIIRPGTRCV